MTPPTLEERCGLLEGLGRYLPLSSEIDTFSIAQRTAGFVLGDFQTLLLKARQFALEDQLRFVHHVHEACYLSLPLSPLSHSLPPPLSLPPLSLSPSLSPSPLSPSLSCSDLNVQTFDTPKTWHTLQDLSISGLLVTEKHLFKSLDKLHSLHSLSIGSVKVTLSSILLLGVSPSLDTKC